MKNTLVKIFIKHISKNSLWSTKPFFYYLAIFTVLLNCALFFHFQNIIQNQNDSLLDSYKVSLAKIIEYDIHLIDKSQKQIFILQDVGNRKAINNLTALTPIPNSKFLYHELKKNNSIFVDIQKIKEIIDEVLPSTLEYQLSFNTAIINNHHVSFNSTNSYEIGDKLKIKLKQNENSPLMKNNREKLIQIIIIAIITSVIFNISIIALFYIRQVQFNRIILKQKKLLSTSENKVKSMQESKLAKNEIDSCFIKKTTEIYAKEELHEVENSNELKQKILKNIGNKDYMFPLMLKGLSKSTIEVDHFFLNLEKSLFSYMFKSRLVLNIDTKYLTIECDREVLYQIIFSITVNIMRFLENQSDVIKYVDIKISENKVIYTYTGYPMSRDNIIKLSSHMLPTHVDIFLLTGIKLFQSIDYHNMVYNFSSTGFKNKIELLFSNTTQEQQTKILNFDGSKRKTK